ncbi:Lazarillo protein [Pseudolycoriella hygida]|uniref:Lazarillo protein n=1 Tax=Pseudolycoriella hygida TaxID=35572 RepID=A0A9Q0MNM0_9DIPT|nr:Lazarillo protein [Pseudolycoriella hygida]
MDKPVFLSVLAVLLASVNGQVVFPRQCPNHSFQTPFIPIQYSGRWYEISRYDTETQTEGDCTVSMYTMTSAIAFSVQYNMLVGPQPIQINGQSVVSFPDENPLRGMLSLSFGGPPTTSNYWILETDFVNFSVVWFCQNLNATHSSETAWVLSRQRTIPPAIQPIVDGVVNQHLVPALLRPTNQEVARCGN